MKNHFLHTDLQLPENSALKIGIILSETYQLFFLKSACFPIYKTVPWWTVFYTENIADL